MCIKMYPARMSTMSRESAFCVEGEYLVIRGYLMERAFARSQKRTTSARAAYATHLPCLI